MHQQCQAQIPKHCTDMGLRPLYLDAPDSVSVIEVRPFRVEQYPLSPLKEDCPGTSDCREAAILAEDCEVSLLRLEEVPSVNNHQSERSSTKLNVVVNMQLSCIPKACAIVNS